VAGYSRPATVQEALHELATGPCTVLAGGTDLYPAWGQYPPDRRLMDVSRIAALHGVTETETGWRIGAATPWATLWREPLAPELAALPQVARGVGGEQIQNLGTVGGNLCHASPAADGLPVWLALGAQAMVEGPRGARQLPVAAFVTGPRKVALAPDELLCALWVPRPVGRSASAFAKLGARRYLVISIASVAAQVVMNDQGLIQHARFAVGSCSAVAQALPALEQRLNGLPVAALNALIVTAQDLAPLTPMDDIRSAAKYRLSAVSTLVERMANTLASLA
jgi:CO/xanthine dehydrogenase FAD-binding subunit